MKPVSNARESALKILTRIENSGGYADALIDEELNSVELNRNDQSLLTEIVMGTLRKRGSIDYFISQISLRDITLIDKTSLNAIRLALYQIIYLDKIPESAAVNESVNLVKHLPHNASSFVNALLRNFLRKRDEIKPPPIDNAANYISAVYSAPKWLVEDWIEQLGERDAAKLAEASSEKGDTVLRANCLKVTRDNLCSIFDQHSIFYEKCRYAANGIILKDSCRIKELPFFEQGFFTVQDESSQIASELLGGVSGETILDACAAPGGKSCAIAAFMGNCGRIIANDLSPKKLHLIEESGVRLGIDIIETVSKDMKKRVDFGGTLFDRIFVDAPCSGLGVIRRNPETKWRVTIEDLYRISSTQKLILENASALLKNGGVMLYSTCSTSRIENESVVDDFLSKHPEFMIENLSEIYPHYADMITDRGFFRSWIHRDKMDGFFAARLRKKG